MENRESESETTKMLASETSDKVQIKGSKPWYWKPGQSGNPAGKPKGLKDKFKPFKEGSVTEEEIQALEGMSKAELITLIKRISGAAWGIGLKTKEEIYDAMLLKLAIGGLTSTDATQTLSYIKEWIDRERGKPVGTSPNINIGSRDGNMEVQVVLVSPSQNVDHNKVIEHKKD